MAQCDGAAAGIDPRIVIGQPQLPGAGQRLGGKGFIEFENIKIIIVSGVVKEDEIAQLIKSGAEDFIRKPFNITELTNKITVVLQMK